MSFDYDTFEKQQKYYSSVRKDLGLDAVWSDYDVENLSVAHPYTNAKTVTYSDHFGTKPIVKPILGSTYAALYVAANACIRDSGDNHHIFVERFNPEGDTLLLTTGS